MAGRFFIALSKCVLCGTVGTAHLHLRFERGSPGCHEVPSTLLRKEAATLPVSSQERIFEIKKLYNRAAH